MNFYNRGRVFTARYVLSPYIKQICLVFKGGNLLRACAVSKHFTTAASHVSSNLLLTCNPTTECRIVRLNNRTFQCTANSTGLDISSPEYFSQ